MKNMIFAALLVGAAPTVYENFETGGHNLLDKLSSSVNESNLINSSELLNDGEEVILDYLKSMSDSEGDKS